MAIPAGHSTINPFIVCDDLEKLILFLVHTFEAVENAEVRTHDDDGLLFHAELQIGGSTIMLAERKPDWPYTRADPGLRRGCRGGPGPRPDRWRRGDHRGHAVLR